MLLTAYLLVVIVECGLSFTASQMGLEQISRHIYDLVDIYSPIPVVLGVMTFDYFLNSNLDVGGEYQKSQGTHFLSIYYMKIQNLDI